MSGPGLREPALAGTSYDSTTLLGAGGGAHVHRRISWAAIFGGVILVVVLQVLLAMLGAGIGLSTVGVAAGTTPDAGSFGLGAGVWWLASSCVALCLGGYVAAWMAGIELRFDGMLHGLVTWGIATLLTLYLLTSAVGGIIGGGFSAIGGLASAAGGGISSAAKPLAQAAGVSPDAIRDQAQAYLQPTDPDPATMSPQDAQKDVAKNLAVYAKGGPDAAAAKERVVSDMAAQMKVSQADAQAKFDDAQAKLKQARDKAVQTAKDAADASAAAAAKTAFAVFVDLLLGGIAAAVGGSLAVQRRMMAVAGRLA